MLSSNNWPTLWSARFGFVDVDDDTIFWLLVEGNETNDTFSVFGFMSCPAEGNFDSYLAAEFGVLLSFSNFFETGWNVVEEKLAAALLLIKLSSEDRKLDEGSFKR